ncbi:MAG: MBL fold metallo-hydrolase [Phycisphaerae bacterium]|nr:MBL fold metallo-hydrolase [Phycisphaerae bacterium]
MEIVWYGLSCFRMTERGMSSVVTDPYYAEVGLPALKLKADIVTVSHDAPGHNNIKAVKNSRIQISCPGEYEIGGVFITVIPTRRKGSDSDVTSRNVVCVFDFEGLTVAHLGSLDYVPARSEIEKMGAVNVVLVPVGGNGALEPAQAAEIISLIEPSIVIPMQYKTGAEKVELGEVSRFLSEMGTTAPEVIRSLKLIKSGLGEETQVVLLEPSI